MFSNMNILVVVSLFSNKLEHIPKKTLTRLKKENIMLIKLIMLTMLIMLKRLIVCRFFRILVCILNCISIY